jgi:hypothetical protein
MDKSITRIIDKTHDESRPIFVAYLNQLEAENVYVTSVLGKLIPRLEVLSCFDAARLAYETLLDLQPAHFDAWLGLAEICCQCGDDPAAIEAANRLPENHPKYVDALLLKLKIATLGEEKNRKDLAVEIAQIVINAGEWGNHHDQLMQRLSELGWHAMAWQFASQWIDHHRGTAESLFRLGLALLLDDRPTDAHDAYLHIWKGAPDYLRPLVGEYGNAIPAYSDAVDGELRRRIDARFEDLQSGTLGQEPIPLKAGEKDFSGLTVMIVGPSRTNRFFPNDCVEQYVATGVECGVSVRAYFDDVIVYASEARCSDVDARSHLHDFAMAVEDERPDVLMLDCGFASNPRTITPAFIKDLRQRIGCRVVCLMRDCLNDNVAIAEEWITVADTLVVGDPKAAIYSDKYRDLHSTVLTLPTIPTERALYHGDEAPRDLPLTFIGSVFHPSRPMVLSALLTADVAFEAVFGDQRRDRTSTKEGYVDFLRRSRATLNVSVHSETERLVTARVWQSIACGTVLVEQENAGTASFFVPYLHYLPWDNVEDIVQIARFLEKNDDYRKGIASAGSEWYLEHYNAARLWATLLDHACGKRA